MRGSSLLLISGALLIVGFVAVWALTRSVVIATVISMARIVVTALVMFARRIGRGYRCAPPAVAGD